MKTYTCAMCGHIDTCRPEEEALAELKEEFGDVNPDDCDIVCDDCWEKVRPINNKELFEQWQREPDGKVQAEFISQRLYHRFWLGSYAIRNDNINQLKKKSWG